MSDKLGKKHEINLNDLLRVEACGLNFKANPGFDMFHDLHIVTSETVTAETQN